MNTAEARRCRDSQRLMNSASLRLRGSNFRIIYLDFKNAVNSSLLDMNVNKSASV